MRATRGKNISIFSNYDNIRFGTTFIAYTVW